MYIYVVEGDDLLVDAGGGMRLSDFGRNKKVCQIMKLTVDISHLWCYIS